MHEDSKVLMIRPIVMMAAADRAGLDEGALHLLIDGTRIGEGGSGMMNTHRLCIADIADHADGSVPSRPHRSSCLMETHSTRKHIDTIIVRNS